MRLTNVEINSIKQSAIDIFGADVQVFLFGSRVDDTKKGGVIDLYIKTKMGNELTHKIKFLVALEQKLGEQKKSMLSLLKIKVE